VSDCKWEGNAGSEACEWVGAGPVIEGRPILIVVVSQSPNGEEYFLKTQTVVLFKKPVQRRNIVTCVSLYSVDGAKDCYSRSPQVARGQLQQRFYADRNERRGDSGYVVDSE